MRKLVMLLLMMALVCLAASVYAGPKGQPDIKGWEKGSDYDRLYDPKEADSLKGRVVKILNITPVLGMAPGIGLQIEDKKDKTLETVQLGPKDFVDLASSGIKEGDEVKAIGAWAEIDGQDVLLAVKVKKDDKTLLKVRRTRDGFPYWSMTPEQRQAEAAGQ